MSSPSTDVPVSPEFPSASSNDGSRLSAFNPFTMVFVGVAYIIIFVYIVRFVLSLVRNLIHRGRFGHWAGSDDAGTEVASIRSESLPSFYKVVVLPDKDVCYGVANDQKQCDDNGGVNQQLRFQLVGEQDNVSEVDHHNPEYTTNNTDDENDDIPIRFFRTASITLEPDFDANTIDEKTNFEIYSFQHTTHIVQNSEVEHIDQNNNDNGNQNVQVFVDIPDHHDEEQKETVDQKVY